MGITQEGVKLWESIVAIYWDSIFSTNEGLVWTT